MKSFKQHLHQLFGLVDRTEQVAELEAVLERKQAMIDRQLALCVALTKLQVLADRGDLKISKKRKGKVKTFVIASTTGNDLCLSGQSIEAALLARSN